MSYKPNINAELHHVCTKYSYVMTVSTPRVMVISVVD